MTQKINSSEVAQASQSQSACENLSKLKNEENSIANLKTEWPKAQTDPSNIANYYRDRSAALPSHGLLQFV
ncbi:MAG: hypothetical protein IPK04_11265 [Bdellovibrionales bacterium]|nr:hypothetical protein [Bdellovibrionales bacterium]